MEYTIERLIAGEIPAAPEAKREAIKLLKKEEKLAERKMAEFRFNERMEMHQAREARQDGDSKKEEENLKFADVNGEVRHYYAERAKKCNDAWRKIIQTL